VVNALVDHFSVTALASGTRVSLAALLPIIACGNHGDAEELYSQRRQNPRASVVRGDLKRERHLSDFLRRKEITGCDIPQQQHRSERGMLLQTEVVSIKRCPRAIDGQVMFLDIRTFP